MSNTSTVPDSSANLRYTLGQLIVFLDGLERNREVQRLNQQEQFRRDPINASLNAVYSAALRWRPDEGEMPGVRRIELLCDLEPGEAGINAAKVRRLRARICQQQRWQPQHADELTLDEAADLLEGVQRVTLEELKQVSREQLHHGLATIDVVILGPGEEVQVTGLSCKVIAGTVPTACPDANPVLPPSLLAGAERAVRRLYPLPAGATIHWVGHDTGVRSRCRCHPNAPFAAPFDQHRWTDVVSPAPVERVVAEPAVSASTGSSPPSTTPAATPPFTVGDIRDFLVYQARLTAYRAGLESLDPMKVLSVHLLPDTMAMERAKLVRILTPPDAPRLTADVAWTLATYRRIAESARAAQREAPVEGDLMGLVGSVAGRTGRSIEELLRMSDEDFERIVTVPATPPSADVTVRLADASRCPECNTPPNPLDVAAGDIAPCRECGLWGLATGICALPLADDSGDQVEFRLHAPRWRRITPTPVAEAVQSVASSVMLNVDAPTKKTGRPQDPTKQEVVKYVSELRDKQVPWKKIPDAVFKKFKVRYTAETLRGYLKSG